MKLRLLFIKKKTLFLVSFILLILFIFFIILNQLSILTLNYYDPIYQGNPNNMKVALGCNVVWGNEYLPDILKILKDNNIKITFFVGGQWASKNEDLLLMIKNDGHEIGNHGYKHLKQSKLSIEQNKQEILKTQEVVLNLTGIKTDLFAPPYGDVNKTVVDSAESLGYKVIMWSIDTIDWNTKNYQKIVERIVKKKHQGAIILMHPTPQTVKALPIMIKDLTDSGYIITNITDVIQ